MGLIRKIRGNRIRKNVLDKNSKKEERKQTKHVGAKFDVIGTSESKKLFSENKGLMKDLMTISKELGIISRKGVPSKYKDPKGRFTLELIRKNIIMTLGDKSTYAKYSLNVSGKKYTVVLQKMHPENNYLGITATLKANIVRASGINVVEPIKAISNRKEGYSMMVYPDYSLLKPINEVLSSKKIDSFESQLDLLNKRIKKTLSEKHKEFGLDPNSEFGVFLNNFKIDPKTKKIFAVFEY